MFVLLDKVETLEAKIDLERCISTAKILMALINSILDYDQIKHNKLKLNKEFHLITTLLDEVCVPLRAIANHKNIDINVEISPQFYGYLYTDKIRVH